MQVNGGFLFFYNYDVVWVLGVIAAVDVVFFFFCSLIGMGHPCGSHDPRHEFLRFRIFDRVHFPQDPEVNPWHSSCIRYLTPTTTRENGERKDDGSASQSHHRTQRLQVIRSWLRISASSGSKVGCSH